MKKLIRREMRFQLGHVFSDMEIGWTRRSFYDRYLEFQLGHVFSDMEIITLMGLLISFANWRFNWATSFQTWK